MRRVLVLTSCGEVAERTVQCAVEGLASQGSEVQKAVRLARNAVEVPFFAHEVAVAALRDAVAEPVDVNIVPAEGRRKRILVADMDSTIIGIECIDELADFAGLKAEVAAVTEAAMRGEIEFEQALVARVRLLAGLPLEALAQAYEERVVVNPGARVLVRTMRANGAATALVSGGFTFFTERVAAMVGFGEHRANVLEVAGGALTGGVRPPILGRAAKREALDGLCARTGLTALSAVAIGDGANDLAMVQAAGLGIAYRAKPALAEAADARLDHSDLSAVLALQGIPEAEWVD